MPIYPALSIAAVAAVLLLERFVLRTGIFRDRAYWVALAICIAFMVPVDGWLTKLSAPIVTYRPEDTSEIRPIWDILAEEYLYAFALLTLVMATWDRLGGRRSAS
jgi:lycopene cyclase domain-containing protein